MFAVPHWHHPAPPPQKGAAHYLRRTELNQRGKNILIKYLSIKASCQNTIWNVTEHNCTMLVPLNCFAINDFTNWNTSQGRRGAWRELLWWNYNDAICRVGVSGQSFKHFCQTDSHFLTWGFLIVAKTQESLFWAKFLFVLKIIRQLLNQQRF